jgi:polysaccharide export outer membrane protein
MGRPIDGGITSCRVVLNCCQNLIHYFRGLVMESGTSSFTCRGLVLTLVFAAFLISMVNGAAAQQPANGTPPAQSTPSDTPAAELPGKPLSQATVSVSEAASGATNSGTTPGPSSGQPANPQAKDATAAPDTPDQSSLVKLGPGDLIELNVYNVPELVTKARVSNSGDVYLPLIDYVHVGGLTQEEAQTLIEKRLEDGGFVRSPHVTIFVDEATSQGVTVIGEVAKPGIYPDPSDHKLYDVISEAGGFSPTSSRKIAILRRNQVDPIRIDLPRNLADDPSGNVEVLPGDTITVPRAPIIYVVGDVGRPSGLLVDNGTLTVLQALALAGGTNRTAKMGGARIIRKGGPTGMTETPLQLKKMLEAKSPDVTLQADDILFVPVSGGRVFAGRSFEAAMSLATTLTIYTVRP